VELSLPRIADEKTVEELLRRGRDLKLFEQEGDFAERSHLHALQYAESDGGG